jgi:hypothetical protein
MDKLTPELTNLLIALASAIVSVIALIYTVLTFLLKRGHKFRCTYSNSSSRDCNDFYISSLTLENLKDRPAVIFEIYLKLGHGYFLQLEDFSEKPLILGGFEVYHKTYDPLLFYEAGSKTIKIDSLLRNKHVKHRLIVSTTEGKKTIKPGMKHWRPHYAFFKNYLTAIIRPQYLTYNDISYGANVKYLLDFAEGGKKHVISFRDSDLNLAWASRFEITKENLSSKDEFQKHIQSLVDAKKLSFDSFEVIDFAAGVERSRTPFEKKEIVAKPRSFLFYHVIGRWATYRENQRLKEVNKENKIKAKTKTE